MTKPKSSQPDTRNWSFARRALYELKVPQPPTRWAWVRVEINLPHRTGVLRNWYQLPKDLQKPIHGEQLTLQALRQQFLGVMINVPLGPYQNGYAALTAGKVIDVSFRRRHAKRPERFTRSQFYRFEPTVPVSDLLNGLRFLQHDFDQTNRRRITLAVCQQVPQLQTIRRLVGLSERLNSDSTLAIMVLLLVLILAMIIFRKTADLTPLILGGYLLFIAYGTVTDRVQKKLARLNVPQDTAEVLVKRIARRSFWKNKKATP